MPQFQANLDHLYELLTQKKKERVHIIRKPNMISTIQENMIKCRPVKELCRTNRGPIARENSRKHCIQITSQTQHCWVLIPIITTTPCYNTAILSLAKISVMLVTQKVIPQWWCMKQCLKHWIHKTRVSKIVKAPQTPLYFWGCWVIAELTRQRTRVPNDQDLLFHIRRPRFVLHAPPLARALRMRRRVLYWSDHGSLRLR